MWMEQTFLAVIGLAAGAAAAGGIFSFIIGLGIVSDFADRTHTGEHIRLYEDAIALGGILGTVFFIFQIPVPAGRWLLAIFGLFGGIFVGCWAVALAEVLNLFPILIRRTGLESCIRALILGIALGKSAGACLFFWQRW